MIGDPLLDRLTELATHFLVGVGLGCLGAAALSAARRPIGVALCRISRALTLWRVLGRPWRVAWQQARRRDPW